MAEQKGEPNEKLVKVFDSREESEAMVVRGLLESSAIQAYMTSPEAAQDILPGVGGTIILVRDEQAEEARPSSPPIRKAVPWPPKPPNARAKPRDYRGSGGAGLQACILRLEVSGFSR